MTVFNISLASKSSKVSWKRLGVVNAAFLLIAVTMGGDAAAAVNQGSNATHHTASTRADLRRGHVRGAQTAVQTKTPAASVADGAELTPLSATPPAAGPKTFATSGSHSASHPVSVGAPTVALPLDRSPVTASMADTHSSLADLLHGAPGAPVDMSMLSAPLAWSVLLAGLLGLFAMNRGPAVARVQSWAMAIPSRSGARSGTRASAIDRVDPARYAVAAVARSNHGHFVRAAAGPRFARV